MIFHILDIEETKDEQKIQQAYRNRLKQTNPENDPEGFKRLRTAYEEATAWARTVDAEVIKEKDAFDLWVDRVDDVYRNIEDCNRVELWEALIQMYREKLETDADSRFDDSIKLAWCYFQNDDTAATLELLTGMNPRERDEYDFVNLYSRALYWDKQYEASLPWLKRWAEQISKTPDDGTKENRKRRERRFQSLHMLSGCNYELKNYDQALTLYERVFAINCRDLEAV